MASCGALAVADFFTGLNTSLSMLLQIVTAIGVVFSIYQGILNARQQVITQQKTDDLKDHVNSKMDLLLELKGAEGHAAGVQQERDQVRADKAADAAVVAVPPPV